MASKNKKKKLLTVDQYERSRMQTVDQYEQKQNERRKEQERQRQLQLKQEEEKKKEEAYHKAFMSTPPGYYYDKNYQQNKQLKSTVLDWVGDVAKRNLEKQSKNPLTVLTSKKQEPEYDETAIKKQAEYKRAANVYEGTADLGSWLSGRTQDVEEALSAKNAKSIRETANELKEYRYFDKGSDVNLWSPEKRAQMREASQKTIDEAQKAIEETQKQLDELNLKAYRTDGKNVQMRRYDGTQGLELQLTDEDRKTKEELEKKKNTYQAKIDYANDYIKKISAQDEKDQKYRELIDSQQTGDTEWHEENINRQELKNWDTALKAASPDGIKFTDKLERVDGVYAALDPKYEPTGDIVGADYKNAILMNDEERNAFISLYNAGKKAEAWSFYEGLQPYLNQAYNYFEKLSINETARRLPVLSSIATEVAHVAQPLEAIMNLPEQIAGALGAENAATDPYSERYIMTRVKNGIRAQVASDAGDWGWVYQGAMSGVDSFMNIALAQGMGLTNKVINVAGRQIPALQTATLALFHTQAFETSLQNTISQGNDQFGYDFIEAWVDAAIETATEIWSVENWLADPKNLLTYVGKIAISEPSEEIVGAVIEPIVKEMIGHKHQYKERANEIIANGGYYDNAGRWIKVDDMDEATRKAMQEWFHDIRMAAQEALVSVGPSIGMGSIRLANQNVNIGRELNPYNEEQTTKQIAEAAAELGEGTDSSKGAQKVQEKLEQGKKVSNYRMGQLAQDVLRESGERTAETAKQTRTEQIGRYLQENGVSEEEAAGLAETVEKAIEKGGIENLTKKERQTIHDNKAATNALYRFGITKEGMADTQTQKALAEEVKNRTQKEENAVKSISDLLTKNAERRIVLREATPDEISETEGERINNNREAIVYDRKTGKGRFAEIEGVEVKKRNGNWDLRLKIAGQERTMRASEVKLTNYQAAQIINQATNVPELYSEGYTKLLLDAANEGQFTNENVVPMMREAKKLRLYSFADYLSDQMPQTELPRQLAEKVWSQSIEEHYRNRKNQVTEYNKKKTGRAVFGDAVFGTQEWTDAVKGLDQDTVDWMETIAGIAQRAGIDVSFKSMTDNDKTWGWEGKEGIGLNISGRNYVRDLETNKVVQTGQHDMMITFGHELTHWLGHNSLQGYNRLEKFVLQNYINDNGYEKFEERINHRMYSMGESLEEAIAEIVADSCDQILLDEQVQQKIAQTDSKLFSEIKGFVNNLVERFKKAIKVTAQESASQYSKAMAAHINEIRKLWMGAYDEVLSEYITDENGKQLTPEEYRQMVAEETGNTAEEISRMSQAELDSAYMDAVENGTEQQQMLFVNEAAERGGYVTEFAYHGTPFFGFTVFNKGRSMNAIFVSYSRELAQIYANDAQVKRISQRAIGNIDNMTDEQLLEVARRYITERAGDKVNRIELRNGKFRISYYDSLDQRTKTLDWDRRTFGQMVQNAVKNTGAMNGVYQLYTRPGRQLVLDAQQAKSNEIKLDGQIAQDMGTDTFNTRMIAKWARENGYDSVRINNVTGNQGIVADYGIFFNEQDVKSADPVTYDENGNVIPVTERFNAQEKDIRRSRADIEITNGIEKGMSDIDRYNELKGTKINVVDSSDYIKQNELVEYNHIDQSTAFKKLRELAKQYNILNQALINQYIKNEMMMFSTRNLNTSIHHQNESFEKTKDRNFINFAALIPVFKETFKNAVPMTVQDDRYGYILNDEETDIQTFAELLGAFKYNNKIIPVKFDIKQIRSDSTHSKLYIIATINKDALVATAPLNSSSVAPASSVISIEDVIKNVNKEDEDILTMIPAYFLKEDQLEGKRNGLRYQGYYILNKAEQTKIINKYHANMTPERIDAAIKKYGSETDPEYSKAYMTYIDPLTFVKLNAVNVESIENESRPLNGRELRNEKQTPYIGVDLVNGDVVGHEGRHRMIALANAGVEKVAILVVPINENGSYNRQTIDSLTVKGLNKTTTELTNLIPVNEEHRKELIDTYSKSDNWFRYSRAELDSDYMVAMKNGDKTVQREILDTAAVKNGYIKKVYHGTPTGGFTTFRDWSYFTENKAYADRYNHPSQSSTRGYAVEASQPMTYELYFNPGRVFDTRDPKTAKIFNQIRMEYGLSELQADGLPDWTDGRDLIEYIEENDLPYDTIILNEGADGGYGAPVVSRGVSYVTRSNMVKSADLVTYDDNGNVIKPTERFDESKNDIRWSRANIEAEGDEVTLDSLNIRRDIYFTGTDSEIDAAEKLLEQRKQEMRNIIEAPDFTALMLKNKPGGRYEILHPSSRKGIRFQLTYYGSDGIPSMHESYGTTGEQVDKNESVHSMDELYKHFADQSYDSKLEMNVLRDNQQNDTRFSRADVEETKDLIAYHNLGPEQLMAVLRLGGFAMPSIAITRDNYVNDRYGDITVLFRKDTIDPKKSSANKVYGGDAWTPVYPTIEYKISEKKMDAVKAKISKLVPSKYQIRLYELDAEDVEKKVNSYRGDIVKAVKDNTNLMAAYLADKGQEVNYPMREKRLDGFNKFDNQQVIRAYNLLGDEVIINAYEMGNTYQYLKDHPEIVNKLRDEMNKYWKDQLAGKVSKETKMKLLDKALYDENNFGTNQAEHLIEAAYKYMKQGIQSELDTYALQDTLRKQVEADEEGYENWLKEQLNGAIEKSGIRNNKDFFDRMGNRRSWETLHDPETLENVVRVMKAQLDKGATGFFSQSELLALGTKDFKSLDDIRKDKARLQHISDEEMSAAKTDIINRFDKLVTALADPRESNQFIERDNVFSAIADTVRTARTAEGIQRIMNEWRYKVTAEQAQEIADLMVEISNLPTEYFEAKPKRAVGLDEIAKVILPENTDQALLDALDDQGIAWKFYDGTSEDRLAKMNENDDVKFSRWTESGMDVNYWMEHATPSMVQTEDERELISMYRGKRTSISLSLKKQGEYRARIRQLEAVDNPSTDVKSELTALRNKLEIEKKKVYRLEEEILQITRNDGWAGMMYQHNMVFRDYVEGRTQEQVRQTIDDMLKLVEQTQEQITKDTENLKKLATHQAVQTMKSFMGKTSMGRMASILRKTYNSTMNKAEIEDRLAEMALKQASGKDITSDTEALAHDLLDRMRGIRTDALESLRGQTFVIGQSLAEELRKENSSIKELQSRIKGSGVKIVTGVKSSTGEIDRHSRISEQWSELRESNAALPNVENMAEIDKLHTIVDFIESELRTSTGAEQFGIDFDEVAAMVRASVGNITTYLTDDPKARAQINNLMKQIADLSKATEKTAADMQGLYGKLDDVVQAGARAKGIATAMERDVNEAIKYYNTTARVAAEKERTKVRKALIAQLRDENTQKLLKQQEKYRSMIENQRKARELHLDNEALRRKISTVASRMASRLFAETDQKNVPEETKGLVREVLRMLAENDSIYRRVTNWDKDRIDDALKRLTRLSYQSGEFVPAKDLDFLVIKAPNEADNDYTLRDKVWQDILEIESGLEEYRAAETSTLVNQQAKNNALTKVQEALSEIYSVIRARSEAFINGKRYEIATLAEQMENEMAGSKYKGEKTGKVGRAFNTMEKMVGYGNLTPEYFFKNLKNGVMNILHGGFHDAEQRAGLEALRAKTVVEQIAKETKYNTWDPQEKHKVKLQGGREIEMTTEQIMALYATWMRESSQLRPEETAHLLKGGFVLAQGDMSEGLYGRQKNDQRPIRMDKATLDGLSRYLTEEQLQYVNNLVEYMSGELAEIGNETSMQQYGIKKFTERFYYPIKAWGGVLNKSSASGIVNKSDARAMRQSFTKNLTANAQNAIEIGDFTPTVMKHIVGMITFNTVGPAVENMNKVLNQQLTYGEAVYDENGEITEDTRYKRNVRAAFQDAYGVNALKYLERFMDDVNGGMTRQQDKSVQEKLLSVFRKGAVAGSLSVAAQQPLSYIRAAMEINPVYLARALSPTNWGKIHDEMLKYSGVAVIKDMGRFDMNQGQSMIDYITPEEKISKERKAGRTAVEATTILPEKMDALTWGRMWIACKMETAAKNKGMDTNSDEFMQKVAQRFNEVMRKTQVYDSLMVKSQNMRSTNYAIKAMTSFMAEPTLSLNVLADAVRNFNSKGGKATMAKAFVTFITSAAAQALVKAIMSSGRSPDKKKRLEEQFYIKWMNLFMSEGNPLTLVPGYSDIIELLKNGELADDAWSVIGKLRTVLTTGFKWATGKSDNPYRSFEDTIGQLFQLMTNVPLKNLMRDARAMYNFMNPETYAQREYSPEVVKYGMEANFWNADNMIGVVNSYLKDAGGGFETSQTAYIQRIYDAERAGNKAEAEALKKYVINTSTAKDPEKTVKDKIRNLYEKDESLSGPEKVQVKLDAGQDVKTIKSWITQNYKQAYIDADTNGRRQLMNELTKMYKLLGISGNDAMKIVTKWVKDEKKKNK